jgi:hypothetical protein
MEFDLDVLLGILTGLGLAAACGFRVFVPLLALSLAARAERVVLADGFDWLSSKPAMVCLVAATMIEIAAYFVPFIDNLLDTIATPLAAVAGVMVTSALVVEVDPWLRWSLALIAGAGLATAVQVPTAAARGGATVASGGTLNAGVATGEVMAAGLLSGISILSPIVAPFLLVAVVLAAWQIRRRRRRPARGPGTIADRRT